MSLDIVLSGPKVSEQQARNALVSAGFDVHATDHAHGMSPLSDGQQAEAFVTITGDDVNNAAEAVRSLGWALRMHFDTPEQPGPSLGEQIATEFAAVRAELAELKAKVA